MVYPNSNLPSASQPWGKAVQRDLENLQSVVATNEINNKARDTQLEKNYKRLDATINSVGVVAVSAQQAANDAAAAANTANTAINNITGVTNNIYVTGTTSINGGVIQTGTLSASKITTGTLDASLVTVTNLNATNITSGTINANLINVSNINASNITSGKMSVDRLDVGTLTGFTIVGGTVSSAASGARVSLSGIQMSIYDANGLVGTLGGNASQTVLSSSSGQFLQLGNGNVNLRADNSNYVYVTSSQITLQSSATRASGNFAAGGTIISEGSFRTWANATIDGSLTRTVLAGGGTTGASFNNSGDLVRTTSSIRYKTDVSDLSFNYNDVLSLEPKQFRLKDEVAEDPETSRYYPGFIAEDIAGTPLDIFVNYATIDGEVVPDGVRYSELAAALLVAIKHQDSLITSLTDRIETLEGK